MARSVSGRPSPIGVATPENSTASRNGRTGNVSRSDMNTPFEEFGDGIAAGENAPSMPLENVLPGRSVPEIAANQAERCQLRQVRSEIGTGKTPKGNLLNRLQRRSVAAKSYPRMNCESA